MRNKIVIEMTYGEFQDLVRKVYRCDYEYPRNEEVSNDSSQSFDGIDQQPIDEYDNDRLQAFIGGNSQNYLARTLLQDMCVHGKLQPGDYLIRCCW